MKSLLNPFSVLRHLDFWSVVAFDTGGGGSSGGGRCSGGSSGGGYNRAMGGTALPPIWVEVAVAVAVAPWWLQWQRIKQYQRRIKKRQGICEQQ
jgi:hypothetical protein